MSRAGSKRESRAGRREGSRGLDGGEGSRGLDIREGGSGVSERTVRAGERGERGSGVGEAGRSGSGSGSRSGGSVRRSVVGLLQGM